MDKDQDRRMAEEVELPEPAGYGVNMHGEIVAFASKAEKKVGMSPGATTFLFTEEQVREAIASALEAQRKALEFEAWEYRERIVPELRAALLACVGAMLIKQRVTLWENDGDRTKFSAALTQAQEALK